MVKKILIVLFAGILLAYIGFTMVYLNFFHTSEDAVCKKVKIEVANTLGQNYISANDVVALMKTMKVFPVGKNLKEINTSEIEEKLANDKLIKRAECFKTVGGDVKIKVYQRIPVLRVFSPNGSYYVDNEREIMPIPANFAAYVPVASGNINREYAKKQLYDFAEYLQKDKFWDSQIAQIYVTFDQDVFLTPTVGSHQIILGKIEDYKENLDKLRTFYEKGLNKIGWNRYSTINLKYKNQVVCTLTDAAFKARNEISDSIE
ncbi:MAG: cell division protein FtsQ [Dysgonamonadaceae bacterium]|jgi:cell division protein FtsQ|nr:cell division protein FtsQ [Dysgonamonadaceae bacterium]